MQEIIGRGIDRRRGIEGRAPVPISACCLVRARPILAIGDRAGARAGTAPDHHRAGGPRRRMGPDGAGDATGPARAEPSPASCRSRTCPARPALSGWRASSPPSAAGLKRCSYRAGDGRRHRHHAVGGRWPMPTPIARLTGEREVIVVPAASPHRTLRDLLDVFVAAPASVSWGGGSAGGTDDLLVRLIAEALQRAAGGGQLRRVLGRRRGAGRPARRTAHRRRQRLRRVRARRLPPVSCGCWRPRPGPRAGWTPRHCASRACRSIWRTGAPRRPARDRDAERDALTARVQRMTRSAAWRETLQRTGWTDAYLDGAAFHQFLLAEQARVTRCSADSPRRTTPAARSAGSRRHGPRRRSRWRPRAAARGALVAATPALPGTARPARAHRAGCRAARRADAAGHRVAAGRLRADRGGGFRRLDTGPRQPPPACDLLVGALLAGTLAALFAWGLGVPLPMGGTAP